MTTLSDILRMHRMRIFVDSADAYDSSPVRTRRRLFPGLRQTIASPLTEPGIAKLRSD